MNKLNRLRLLPGKQRRQIVLNSLIALVIIVSITWWQGATALADGIWTGPNALFNGVYPRVVVRPTDGDIFVIATDYSSNIYYGDSGHGYNPVTISSVSGSAPARPRGAFDSNGTLYVVWQQRNLSSGQYCTYYTTIDKNNNIGSIRNLTTELGLTTGKEPDVAVSPVDGHIYIAQEYDNANVNVLESDNGGASFSNSGSLGSGIGGNTGTRIAVDKNNIVHFVFDNGTNIIARERINGTWTGNKAINPASAGYAIPYWPYITVGPSGDAYVVWQENFSGGAQISYARWDHSSQSWQSEIQNVSQSSGNITARVPSVSVGSEGNVWITWEVDTNGAGPAGARYTYSTDGGSTFRNIDVIAGLNFTRSGPWADATAANGQIYFAGQLSGSGSYQIWLAATKSDGSGGGTTTGGGGGGTGGGTGTGSNGWSNPTAVLGGVYPTIAVRPSDGDVFVVATDYVNNIYYGDSAHNYSSVTIANSASTYPARPRAVFDANNNLQVVWMQRGSGGQYDTMYTTINSSGAIGSIRDLTQEAGLSTGKEPDIAVSPVDGHIYIAEEYNNGAVGVIESSNGGANFSGIVSLGSGIAGNTGTRLTVDKNNIVHFVYVNGTDVIARERINGSWTGAVKVDSAGTPKNRAFWPSIAADPDGDVYVVWQEDSASFTGGSEISYARWDHSSQSWQSEIQNVSQTSSGSIDARVPSVAVSSDGKVFVTFEVDSNGGSPAGANFNVSTDGGRTFSTAGVLISQNYTRPGSWSDAKAGNGQIYFAGQLDGGNGYQIWVSSLTTVNKNPPTGNPLLTTNNTGFAVRLNLSNSVKDPGTGVASVQVSNDPNFGSYLELPYNSNLTSVLWSLGASQYGGNYSSGTKTVYVRYKSGTGYINATPYALTTNVTESTSSFTSTLYNAEGDTTSGKSEYLSFYNASGQDGTISVVYRDTSGNPSYYGYPIAAGGRATVTVAVQNKHAAVIASDLPLQGEDLNFGSGTGMDGIALNSTPALNFYFANGSTNGGNTGFELYNPGANAASVTITFTNWGGGTIGSAQTVSVPAQTVVSVPNVPANTTFATQISVTNNQPILVTRRMTLANGAFATSNGVSKLSSGWLFAGGDTGTGNSDSIGVFNPNSVAVTLTYQLYKNDGTLAISTTQTLAANAAIVTPISQFLHPFGVSNHNANVSEWQVVVKATDANNTPQLVAAEQQQLSRGGNAFATEIGSSVTASKWVVLSTSIPNVINDNIIITNFSNQPATAQIAAYDEMGQQLCTNCSAISIPAFGQVRVPTTSLGGVAGNRVALVVTGSNSLVVEHVQSSGTDTSLVLGQPLSSGITPSFFQPANDVTKPTTKTTPNDKGNPITSVSK